MRNWLCKVFAITGCLLLGDAGAGGFIDAAINGPTQAQPDSGFHPYTVSWTGGQPPFTVVFDASEPGFDRRQEFMVDQFSCDPGPPIACTSFEVPVQLQRPQIASWRRIKEPIRIDNSWLSRVGLGVSQVAGDGGARSIPLYLYSKS